MHVEPQDLKAELVAWNGGRHAAKVPTERLSLIPWFLRAVGTVLGVALLLYAISKNLDTLGHLLDAIRGVFASLHTESCMLSGFVDKMSSGSLQSTLRCACSSLTPLEEGFQAVVRSVRLWLVHGPAGEMTERLVSWILSGPGIATVSLGIGLLQGYVSLPLQKSKSLSASASRWKVLREDWKKLWPWCWGWLMFAFITRLHTRAAANDVQTSFGKPVVAHLLTVNWCVDNLADICGL